MKSPYTNSKANLFFITSIASLFCLVLILINPKNSEGKNQALAPRTDDEQHVIDAYSRSNRGVVHINSRLESYDFYMGLEIKEGTGSGVIVNAKQALIATNYHVIEGSNNISVTLADGKTYPAIKIGSDAENDIALIQIHNAPSDLVEIELADSDVLAVGQRVLAIGNPFGLDRTLTTGIISSLGRTIEIKKGQLLENLIQTDAAINQGNSGGPLLDSAGRVIGLNTVILSQSGASAGIGFAIPINQVKRAIPQLIKYGRVLRPKIGVSLADTDWGVLVLFVQPNGPAAIAGIHSAVKQIQRGQFTQSYLDPSEGHYITAVNGNSVKTKAQALDFISKSPQGQKIKLTVRKGLNGLATKEMLVDPILD